MPKVLVTDASKNAALAVIRSLGSRDIDVTAGESTGINSGFMSKSSKRRIDVLIGQRTISEEMKIRAGFTK